jgi:hypothetical protein
MAKSPKPKLGRPALPKGEAKGKIVPVRFNASDMKRVTAAARANKQTLSGWIRSTLKANLEAFEAQSPQGRRNIRNLGQVVRGGGEREIATQSRKGEWR